MMKWHDLVQICIFVICNIYIYIYITIYPQWDRYQQVGLPRRGFSGEGIMLWLRIWKRPFLTGQWLPGRCGGGDDRNVKVLWSYSGPQMNESMNWKHSVEWNDFNLELNVVLASTCTVQVDAPRATIITALGGWIFRDFGALWSKVPCSISDFNGNIIDVFIIWCFFLHLRFFRCCCVQSPGLLIKRRALEVIMKDNMALCDIVPQCGVVVLVGVVAVVYIRARVNTEAQKTP